MDEERIVESFREAWNEPWFLGFAVGVLATGVVELALAWWHDHPSTFQRCVECRRYAPDVIMDGEAWHARCWWAKRGDTLPAWLTETPAENGATSSSEPQPQPYRPPGSPPPQA